MQREQPKNLSRHQYGDLLYFSRNLVTVSFLRTANMNTLASLLARGYLKRWGSGEDAEIKLTALGEEALAAYTRATMNERKHEADITDRCLRLLRHSRNLNELRRVDSERAKAS